MVPVDAVITIPGAPARASVARVGTAASTETSSAAPSRTSTRGQRTYEVRHGDTLSSIAEEFLGTRKKWRTLYLANQSVISNPNAIRVGTRLVIPN